MELYRINGLPSAVTITFMKDLMSGERKQMGTSLAVLRPETNEMLMMMITRVFCSAVSARL